jgi:hypothetical protein
MYLLLQLINREGTCAVFTEWSKAMRATLSLQLINGVRQGLEDNHKIQDLVLYHLESLPVDKIHNEIRQWGESFRLALEFGKCNSI